MALPEYIVRELVENATAMLGELVLGIQTYNAVRLIKTDPGFNPFTSPVQAAEIVLEIRRTIKDGIKRDDDAETPGE